MKDIWRELLGSLEEDICRIFGGNYEDNMGIFGGGYLGKGLWGFESGTLTWGGEEDFEYIWNISEIYLKYIWNTLDIHVFGVKIVRIWEWDT